MRNAEFFDNPDFLKYVRLLHELHATIREGNDESAESERIRDQMDEPASRLSSDEIDSVHGISGDFYSVTDPLPTAILPQTAEVNDDLAEVLRARPRRTSIVPSTCSDDVPRIWNRRPSHSNAARPGWRPESPASPRCSSIAPPNSIREIPVTVPLPWLDEGGSAMKRSQVATASVGLIAVLSIAAPGGEAKADGPQPPSSSVATAPVPAPRCRPTSAGTSSKSPTPCWRTTSTRPRGSR